MEVCGTHTAALFTTGIRRALPDGIRCISGPGCPVCVTTAEEVEKAIMLAGRKNTVLFSFGDMVRVPAASGSLESARAQGRASLRVMYSPREALEYARKEPDADVVLLGVGFETTAPAFAAVLTEAGDEKIGNLYLLPAFKLLPPALDALLAGGDAGIDGFILPGHVSVIIGVDAYRFLPERYGLPGVVTGFEAVDILEGILMLLEMIERGEPAVRNQYTRFVSPEGNPKARALVDAVFAPCSARWRGLGEIAESGLRLKSAYGRFNAEALIDAEVPQAPEPEGCLCGEVIRGKRIPPDCALYKTRCNPSSPIGPCMVSGEGTCAAYFKYGSGRADHG
jgi:hydrogenase expression/formation protein HypD